MIFEWDDFGTNHIISDMCQSHDCRAVLEQLKQINPEFKCTLFAIPGETTRELLDWANSNNDWVELAVHGFFHSSNYECAELSYDQFDDMMEDFDDMIQDYFVKGFRAPGWQISTEALMWLKDEGWWVADQSYNDNRRPKLLPTYRNTNGVFDFINKDGYSIPVQAYHGHVWDVGEKGNEPNGIYEDFEKVERLVKETTEFKFISELFK